MKIVINVCYGGFMLSDEMCEKLGTDKRFNYDRTDPKLIELVENMPNVQSPYESTELRVITIPDDVTDWTVIIYDGIERIIFVRDGKLCEAYWDHYNGSQVFVDAGGERVY